MKHTYQVVHWALELWGGHRCSWVSLSHWYLECTQLSRLHGRFFHYCWCYSGISVQMHKSLNTKKILNAVKLKIKNSKYQFTSIWNCYVQHNSEETTNAAQHFILILVTSCYYKITALNSWEVNSVSDEMSVYILWHESHFTSMHCLQQDHAYIYSAPLKV